MRRAPNKKMRGGAVFSSFFVNIGIGAGATSHYRDIDVNTLRQVHVNGGNPNYYFDYYRWQFVRDYECMKILFEHGFNPNISQGRPFNIVVYAIGRNCSLQTLELLLQNGADMFISTDSTTPLHCRQYSCGEYVDLLVQYGCPVNTVDVYGYMPLDIMIHYDQEYAITALAKYAPKMNRPTPEKYAYIRRVCPKLSRQWTRTHWLRVLCAVRLLALHHRAVVTANAPERLEKVGYFQLDTDTK